MRTQNLLGLVPLAALLALGACADGPTAPVVRPTEASAARTVGFTITELGATDALRPIVPLAINSSDVVVGRGFTPGLSTFHAFRWRRGTLVDLAPAATYEGQASAVNDAGDIVGYRKPGPEGFGRAFLWRDGAMTDLGTLGGSYSYASDINDRGDVVGWSEVSPGLPGAFLWHDGVMTKLASLPGGMGSLANGINAAGEIVGWSWGSIYLHSAVVWRKGVPASLGTLGGVASEAIAINSRGDVVGWSSVSGSNAQHPVLWRDGGIADLGTLGGSNANPTGIDARGDVVGWSETATGEIHAFFWSDGVMTDLAPNDPTSFANGINAAGDVVGTITRGGRILGVIWQRR